MDEDIRQSLQSIVEGTDRDMGWAEDRYREAVQEAKDNAVGELDEEEIRVHALGAVRGDVRSVNLSAGEVQRLPSLIVGYSDPPWDGSIFAKGIVKPEEKPPGLASFVFDDDDISLGSLRNHFVPCLKTFEIWATCSDGELSGRGWPHLQDDVPPEENNRGKVYVCKSANNSKINQMEPEDADPSDPISELPQERKARREFVNQFLPEPVTIENISEHTTLVDTDDNSLDFGADLRRFRGKVVDSHRQFGDDGDDFGTVTLLDEDVANPQELPDESDVIGDGQRTAGLQVYVPPEYVVGKNSTVDVYGSLSVQDGDKPRVVMNGTGLVPIVEYEYEGDSGEGSSSSEPDEDDISETKIS